MDRPIRYGVLGTGRIASCMVDHIRESNNSEVVAVAASNPAKASSFSKDFKIERHYGDYQALLGDDAVDAIYIALPNSMHFELCKQALENGKHVLCEKPFVLESKQLDILEKISKAGNLKIMECFWYRFHPLVDRIISSVARDIGIPLGFYSTYSFLNTSKNDIRWDPDLGGGALYDLMCYHIDAINYIFKPDISTLNYIEAFSRQRNCVDANVNVEALFLDQFQIILSSSIDRQSLNRTTVVGTEGSIVVPNLRMSPGIGEACFYLLKNGKRDKVSVETVNPYARMVKMFSDSIIKNEPAPVTIKESKQNLVFLEKIKNSMRLEMSDRVGLYSKAKRKFGAIFSAFKRKRSI